MNTEVANQEAGEVAVVGLDAFGAGPMTSSDIVIPKILAMQGLSKLVIDGKARFGDLVDSLSGEVISDIEKGVEFIPFHVEKVWIISKWNGSKFEFERYEDVNADNENKPWEEDIQEGKFKNEKTFNFYCIRPDDMSLPVIVSLKGTSVKTGKELMTQMYVKNRAEGKVPPAKVMKLTGIKQTNDKGTFVVLKTAVVRDSSTEEINKCLEWFRLVSSGKTKADDSEAQETSTPDQF